MCAHHRWQTLLGWVLLVAAAIALGSAVGTAKIEDFRLSGTESQRAYDVLAAHSPQQNGPTDQLVYVARDGTLKDAALRALIDRSLARVRKEPIVVDVVPPRLTPDERIGVVNVTYVDDFEELEPEQFQAVQNAAFTARRPGLQVEHGGQRAQFVRFSEQGQGSSEFIGLAAAFFVLLVMLGSLIAAGIPLLTAVFALGATFGLVPVISQLVDTPECRPARRLIGIGVGIDYALIVVTRYRAERARGLDREEALLLAMDTAGRTVFLRRLHGDHRAARAVAARPVVPARRRGRVGDRRRADDACRADAAARPAQQVRPLDRPAASAAARPEATPGRCRRAGRRVRPVGRQPGVGALVGGGAAASLGGDRPVARHPAGARAAGPAHAAGNRRRRPRSAGHDDACGVRPHRRGLRSRHERIVPARSRSRAEGRQDRRPQRRGRGRTRSGRRRGDAAAALAGP